MALVLVHFGEPDIDVGKAHQQHEHHHAKRARIAEVEILVGRLERIERQHLRRATGAARR